MQDELTEIARAKPIEDDVAPAFEIVYEIDAKLVSKAYKRFLWRRARKLILILSSISLACLVAVFTWEMNIFLVLGGAYPAAYIVMWFAQIAQIEEGYEALQGRKMRLLFDRGGISSYSGNTFKRVQWPGVSRMVLIGGYYFIYFERDPLPGGGFPESVVGEDAMEFVRSRTQVLD